MESAEHGSSGEKLMQICKAGTGTFTGDLSLTQCQYCRFGASWS